MSFVTVLRFISKVKSIHLIKSIFQNRQLLVYSFSTCEKSYGENSILSPLNRREWTNNCLFSWLDGIFGGFFYFTLMFFFFFVFNFSVMKLTKMLINLCSFLQTSLLPLSNASLSRWIKYKTKIFKLNTIAGFGFSLTMVHVQCAICTPVKWGNTFVSRLHFSCKK